MLLEPKLSSRPPSGSFSSTTTAESVCSDMERRRAANIVSCHPDHWQEATGIAKALGHGIAANNEPWCDINNGSWRDAYLTSLVMAGTYDDWIIICGSGGRSDLGRLQRLELEVLEKLLQTRSGKLVSHTGGRLLTFVTMREYRSEQVWYVQSLEMELQMLKKKRASSCASSSLSLEEHGMCSSSPRPAGSVYWTPVALQVKGCQYLGSFNGVYVLQPAPHHGRNCYVRKEADAFKRRSSIYFWDERDGEKQCGWWLGIERGESKVIAAYNTDKEALVPPSSNWMVRNWSGWVLESTLQILQPTF